MSINNLLLDEAFKLGYSDASCDIMLEMNIIDKIRKKKTKLDELKAKYSDSIKERCENAPSKIKTVFTSSYLWIGFFTLVSIGATSYEEINFVLKILTDPQKMSFNDWVHIAGRLSDVMISILTGGIVAKIVCEYKDINEELKKYDDDNTKK